MLKYLTRRRFLGASASFLAAERLFVKLERLGAVTVKKQVRI